MDFGMHAEGVPMAPPPPVGFMTPLRPAAAAAAAASPSPAHSARCSPVSSPLLSPPRAPSMPMAEALELDAALFPAVSAAAAAAVAVPLPSSGEGSVSSLASEFMLLEYAAELKGLTQLSIVRGVKAAQHLPRELKEVVRRVRSQAVRIVQTLRAEIAEITSGRRAAAGQMKRIRNAHGHLQAATELLNQAEVQTVTAAKRRRQSSAQRPPPPPTPPQAPAFASPHADKSAAVNNLAAFLANMVALDQVPAAPAAAPTTAAVAADITAAAPLGGSSTADTSAPGGKNLLALQEQIQMLKQQMETMARLQSLMPAAAAAVAANISSGTSAAVASSGPAIPLAPSMGSAPPRITAPVPPAPALTPDSLFFAGKTASSTAPPSAVPQAPVMTPGGPAPPATAPSSTPMSARSAMLGEITARANNAQTTKRVSGGGKNGFSAAPGKKRLSQRSQSTIDTGSAAKNAAAVAAAAPGLKVYVRNVPCSTGSLTECIKVGAAVPLRRTDIARSPGGTPIRDGRPSSNSTQDVLHAAIQARFRNANGGLDVVKQRSQSVMMGRGAHAHALALAANRRDSGEVDKENWETS